MSSSTELTKVVVFGTEKNGTMKTVHIDGLRYVQRTLKVPKNRNAYMRTYRKKRLVQLKELKIKLLALEADAPAPTPMPAPTQLVDAHLEF